MLRRAYIEADTIESARNRIQSVLAAGESLFAVGMVENGGMRTEKSEAATVEQAVNAAEAVLPPGSTVLDRRIIAEPWEKRLRVNACDELNAKEKAIKKSGRLPRKVMVRAVARVEGKRGFLNSLRSRWPFEVDVFSAASVEVDYQPLVRLHVWLTSEGTHSTAPYRTQVIVDRGIGCLFELPEEWRYFENTVILSSPATREIAAYPHCRYWKNDVLGAKVDDVSASGLLHFVPSIVKDELKDRQRRLCTLEKQIREQTVQGTGFRNIRFPRPRESLGGEPNTIVAYADATSNQVSGLEGQITVSCVRNGIHYMFEYYGRLTPFADATVRLLLSSFVFPPVEVVERLRSGRASFDRRHADPALALLLSQITARR